MAALKRQRPQTTDFQPGFVYYVQLIGSKEKIPLTCLEVGFSNNPFSVNLWEQKARITQADARTARRSGKTVRAEYCLDTEIDWVFPELTHKAEPKGRDLFKSEAPADQAGLSGGGNVEGLEAGRGVSAPTTQSGSIQGGQAHRGGSDENTDEQTLAGVL